MKKTIFYYLGILWAMGTLSGCEDETALEYGNDPRLYFYNDQYGQRDSIAHSFFVLRDDQMLDTVWLDVRTMGDVADYDRPVELVLTNVGKLDAAVPGTHFLAFDNAEVKKWMVIPTGQVKTLIPIVIKRDQSLKSSVIRFELAVGENQYFKPGIDKWSTFVITTTEMAAKPDLWDTWWKHTFGTWGAVKMKFIVDYVGYSDFDVRVSDSGYRNYLIGKAKQKLLEYNLAHPNKELKEADGTPVEF
ncbi:MAG: DUF4843 domain-containing protein [Odoribacter sp.]